MVMTGSKRFRRYLTAGLALGVLLLGGAVALGVPRGPSPEGRLDHPASSFAKSDSPSAVVEGMNSRDVDPANAAQPWISDSVTREQLETLELAVEGSAPFEQVEPIIGFNTGLAIDDDEFGRKSLECRLRFERKLAQDPCSPMQQNIGVVDGKVVYVDPRLPDDATNECRAFSRCMQIAWQGRPAPPLGDGSSSYKTVASVRYIMSSLHEGMSDAEYREYYEARMADIKDTQNKRQAYVEESKANGDWDSWGENRRNSFPRNMLVADSQITDHELMIELLQKEREG